MATILVVDDDPSARQLLAAVLGYLGYGGHQIRETVDGAEALLAVQSERPDLIIADLLMPTMDGFEFVRRLRESTEFARTPVVFYTASYLETEARNLAYACGVEHIITKPAEPEQILQIVKTVLGVPQPGVTPPPEGEFRREQVRLLTSTLLHMASHAVPRLDAMIKLGLRLASERQPRRLLELFCQESRGIIGAKYATVGLLDAPRRALVYPCASGMNATIAAALTTAAATPLSEALHDDAEARRLCELDGESPAVGLPEAYPPVHALLSVPIASTRQVYGWLCLADKVGADAFNEEDEKLAELLAAQVGRLYEHVVRYEDLKRYVDELEAERAQWQATQAAAARRPTTGGIAETF